MRVGCAVGVLDGAWLVGAPVGIAVGDVVVIQKLGHVPGHKYAAGLLQIPAVAHAASSVMPLHTPCVLVPFIISATMVAVNSRATVTVCDSSFFVIALDAILEVE